jgi:hypothetical protein
MVAPGAVAADTSMSIAPLTQAALPASLPSIINFAGAFNLDVGSTTLNDPVQLVVPANGLAVGTEVYFYQYTTLPDANGNPFPVWMESEEGQVEADGFIHTTSLNQVLTSGVYGYGWSPTGVSVTGNVTFAGGTAQNGAVGAIIFGLGLLFNPYGSLINMLSGAIQALFAPAVEPLTMMAIPPKGFRP